MLLPAVLKHAKKIRLHFLIPGNAADQSSVFSALMWCHTVCKAPLFLKSALFFMFELLIRLGNCSIFCSVFLLPARFLQ